MFKVLLQPNLFFFFFSQYFGYSQVLFLVGRVSHPCSVRVLLLACKLFTSALWAISLAPRLNILFSFSASGWGSMKGDIRGDVQEAWRPSPCDSWPAGWNFNVRVLQWSGGLPRPQLIVLGDLWGTCDTRGIMWYQGSNWLAACKALTCTLCCVWLNFFLSLIPQQITYLTFFC